MEPKDAILNKEAEEKDQERFDELNKVLETERTEEQKKELGELKERYGKRMQKKINSMTTKQRELEEENEKIKKELEDVKKEKDTRRESLTPEAGKDEVVEIAGKKYFTDKALRIQLQAGEITEDEAYTHQRKRDKEEIKADLRREHEDMERKKIDLDMRKEDIEKINKEYPMFNKNHPDFDPEDPLYKLANEMYSEAYAANPKGLSLAIKRAKEILRISDAAPDRSGDHSVEGSDAPERGNKGKKETTLNDGEKESAIRMYTRGDVLNPKTNRPYTVDEALAKALNAKKERQK